VRLITARLVWASKPKRPPSPRGVEFRTAEIVIPNPVRDAGSLPFQFRDGILDHDQVDRSRMNHLIWGDNLVAMQELLAQGYEGKIDRFTSMCRSIQKWMIRTR